MNVVKLLFWGRLGRQGSTAILLKYPIFEDVFCDIFSWAKQKEINIKVRRLTILALKFWMKIT